MTIQANFPAIKPSLMLDFANTKQLDSRITYTRASTASYYDGVTTSKAEENQLTYSNEISTARWTGTALSTTINNSTSPDGTTTATLLTATANADSRLRLTTTQAVSTTHTFSVYAKAGATSWLRLRNLGSNDCNGWFNLTTGAVGTVSGGTSAITSVGSGWYRCSITSTSAASIANNLLDMGAPSGDNTAAAAGGETISVWGAQLEARSSATAYTATTTQAITNYIPKLQSAASGVARFDNNPTTGESLGLLIEESRTNLFTYSEQFDNAAWTKSQSTINANNIVAPDGTLTGDELVPNTTSAEHYCQQSYTKAASAITYSITVYAKASASGYKFLISTDDAVTGGCSSGVFNLSTGVFDTSSSGTIFTFVSRSGTSVGNGWYRINFVITTNTATALRTNFFVYNASNVSTFAGNGFSGVFVWGAQLEAGAFATSYIPTVASQVTRAADAASMTGTNFSTWYRADEGTLFIDANGNQPQLVFSNANSGYNNYRSIFRAPSQTNQPVNVYEANNGTAAVNSQPMGNTSLLTFKCAYGFKTNDFGGSVNAGTVATDTSGLPALAVDRMGIGVDYGVSATAIATGIYRKIAFYPLKVTSAQLQALTS